MMIVTMSVETIPSNITKGIENEINSQAENKEINRSNLEAYVRGCGDIALCLHTTIKNVIETGKRPVILIPSRGAVPIFILARKILNELDEEKSYLSETNVRYYPHSIFNYLEGQAIQPPPPEDKTAIDVILYPFTADVSAEHSKRDEKLAKRLRESCTRSILEIVMGTDFKSYDLAWYQFLMQKLNSTPQDEAHLKPSAISESIKSYPKSENSQIIIIDTVISGRAAHDIISAFSVLNHQVVPILAVDSAKGGKFQSRRKADIEANIPWELIAEDGPFFHLPLLTEDKGAALLGLVAVNFANFNEEGVFQNYDQRFPSHFLPQSCLWTLPPISQRATYLANFRQFLDLAWQAHHNNIDETKLNQFKESSKALTATHYKPSFQEISSMVKIPKGTDIKETASHIISLKLPQEEAANWIKEFASQLKRSK